MTGFLLIVTGLSSFLAALFDWDWWFESPKVRIFTRLFSRTGARFFYGVLGILCMIMAFWAR